MLWLGVLALSILFVTFVLVPVFLSLLSSGQMPALRSERKAMNLAIYENRLAELEEEGHSQEALDQLKKELKKDLLQDTYPPELEARQMKADSFTGDTSLPRTSVKNVLMNKSVLGLMLVAFLLPILAIFIYADWGLSLGAGRDLGISHDLEKYQTDMEQLPAVLERLKGQLQSQKGNDEGWYLYGQYSIAIENYGEAMSAFLHLKQTYPEDGNLAAVYAEAHYLAEDKKFTKAVRDSIDEALALSPHQVTMLELKGIDAWQSGDNETSLKWLRQALATNPHGTRARMLQDIIGQLERNLGLPVSAGELQITVEVSLGGDLNLPRENTVFVYAQAVDGPPMPLSITRFTVADLPRQVMLTESMSVVSGVSLASYDLVRIIARVSASGAVEARPGDYEAQSEPFLVSEQREVLNLVINERISDLVTRPVK